MADDDVLISHEHKARAFVVMRIGNTVHLCTLFVPPLFIVPIAA
jgi:hypothetical protein